MAKENVTQAVNSADTFNALLERVRQAQQIFATFTQEQVDAIFKAAAVAANQARIPLSKMAVEETGMGVVEDKVIKNHYAAEYVYNAYKNVKTCGVVEEDPAFGIKKILEPVGVIGAVIPTTILNKIIEKMEAVGMILPLVTRTAYKGGVSIPTSTAKPVASWVG